jgi:hypothetical protein
MFSASPSAPKVGETVTFTSSSTDADGAIVAQTWDLDGNGSYNDASGASASRAFPAEGTNTVKLKVVDNRGAESTATIRITVSSGSGDGNGGGSGGSSGNSGSTGSPPSSDPFGELNQNGAGETPGACLTARGKLSSVERTLAKLEKRIAREYRRLKRWWRRLTRAGWPAAAARRYARALRSYERSQRRAQRLDRRLEGLRDDVGGKCS